MKLRLLLSFFILVSTGVSLQAQDSLQYLFVGHCYQRGTDGSKVDYRIEQLDKTGYEGIWLGGDVCSEAMLEHSTVQFFRISVFICE